MACRVCWSFRRPASKKYLAAIEVSFKRNASRDRARPLLSFRRGPVNPEHVAFLLIAFCCCLVMGMGGLSAVARCAGRNWGQAWGNSRLLAAIGLRFSPLSCRPNLLLHRCPGTPSFPFRFHPLFTSSSFVRADCDDVNTSPLLYLSAAPLPLMRRCAGVARQRFLEPTCHCRPADLATVCSPEAQISSIYRARRCNCTQDTKAHYDALDERRVSKSPR